jgi:hypothetical protein
MVAVTTARARKMQHELVHPGPLLTPSGELAQVGWARRPLLDCNLENAAFYPRWRRALQRLRIKRWDYYAVFTPERFFAATIADLGYAGNVFVYTVDLVRGDVHEEGLVIPLGRGLTLPRNSDRGDARFEGRGVRLDFRVTDDARALEVDWPRFRGGLGLKASIRLRCPPTAESMTIVIPIAGKRFYYNRKINCLPAQGVIRCGEREEVLDPRRCAGSLDWGRGIWPYRSFWNWASASGFLADGRTVGLNLGRGFGDLGAATENCLILDGRIHKLGAVTFDYAAPDYRRTWRFRDDEGRLALDFEPFVDRVATTRLGVIDSEVHQVFGRYSGRVVADDGEAIAIAGLVGFAEEHRARW